MRSISTACREARQLLTQLRQEAVPDFSAEQLQIIDGSLLGDGTVSKYGVGSCRNAYLSKKQRASARDYLEWLFKKLTPYSQNIHNNRDKSPTHDRITGRISVPSVDGSYNPVSIFYTRQHPRFNTIRDRWYGSGEKRVPEDLVLSPLTVAVWYMDDGSNAPGYEHAYFMTQSFHRRECEFLCDQLQALGIGCAIKPDGDGKCVIRIHRRWYPCLIDMVRPYFEYKSMLYKVTMDPHEYMKMRGRTTLAGSRTRFELQLRRK